MNLIQSFTVIACCSFLFTSHVNASDSNIKQSQDNVIVQLVTLIENNVDLDDKFANGFNNQPDSSPWKGKTVEDFYSFFAKWLKFNPRLETSKKYVDEFKSFYVLPNHGGSIKEAREAIIDERFSKWLKMFVIARGAYLSSPESKSIVQEWAKEEEVAIGQYDIPDDGFSSFNKFFSRKIKKGVRPIYGEDDTSSLISPADCTVWRDSGWLEVKGDSYNLSELIGNEKISKKYKNGTALVCFLLPDNYHRFHAPVSGEVSYINNMDGKYFGTKGFIDHFHEKRRATLELKMKNDIHVALVGVGIATISSVKLFKALGDSVTKGEEIGKFEFGGSAIVLLFEPNSLKSTTFDKASSIYNFRSTNFLMGQLLGILNK